MHEHELSPIKSAVEELVEHAIRGEEVHLMSHGVTVAVIIDIGTFDDLQMHAQGLI